jgi:hypothetical protein
MWPLDVLRSRTLKPCLVSLLLQVLVYLWAWESFPNVFYTRAEMWAWPIWAIGMPGTSQRPMSMLTIFAAFHIFSQSIWQESWYFRHFAGLVDSSLAPNIFWGCERGGSVHNGVRGIWIRSSARCIGGIEVLAYLCVGRIHQVLCRRNSFPCAC